MKFTEIDIKNNLKSVDSNHLMHLFSIQSAYHGIVIYNILF